MNPEMLKYSFSTNDAGEWCDFLALLSETVAPVRYFYQFFRRSSDISFVTRLCDNFS